MDFFTNRFEQVKLSPHKSPTVKLSTDAPQGCVLSLLLYSLYTNDCTPVHPSNSIINFADDTTAVGLTSSSNASADRDEIQRLSA